MKNNNILKLAEQYEQDCNKSLLKLAYIKKLPNGKYEVVSRKGKNLGITKTREEAVKRLQQVEYFKNIDDYKDDDSADVSLIKDDEIDLTNATDFSYSAIMREMRKNASKDQVRLFMKLFKKQFDKCLINKLQKPEKIALQNALIKFNRQFKVKCKMSLVKNAALTELGDAALVGKYLANIVKFTINKISPSKRHKVIHNLRSKFYGFNANEIAQKKMPNSASIGQSITFVKNVLFNHDPQYIREVLNHLVHNLK